MPMVADGSDVPALLRHPSHPPEADPEPTKPQDKESVPIYARPVKRKAKRGPPPTPPAPYKPKENRVASPDGKVDQPAWCE